MKRFLLTGILMPLLYCYTYAQVSLTNGSPSVLIDFSNSMPVTVGSNPATAFAGTGFSPNPATAGRLNSNAWASTGWDDGSLVFGGTRITAATDYTRGTAAGTVTVGGFYAYTGTPASAANPFLMIQPANGDFEPGTLTLRLQNNGTDNITSVSVSYNIYIRNDQDRSNSFNFLYSTDNTSYTAIAALDYASPATQTGATFSLVGTAPSRSTVISGLNIAPGEFLYLRWSSAAVSGSGSRDEFGLDDINVTATFTPPSTDYYRTVTSGNWNNSAIWESSPDNSTWSPAIIPPTSVANTIRIRNTHTVTLSTNVTADQVIIENGGTLNYTGAVFTVNDGAGDDIDIQSGGAFVLLASGTTPAFSGASPVINVSTGGILRVSAAGVTTTAGSGVHAANYVYQHQSVMEYTLSGGFGSNGVTYFPNVNATTIPIFRTTANSGTMFAGANATTTFNGVFEQAGNNTIQWQNPGDKIFRNGIRNNGSITYEAASIGVSKFIINGQTAELGGTGALNVPPTNGLEIGSATGTQVSMVSNKTVTGNISLLSTNTYVNLGTYNLTVTGTISGGSATSYIRTISSGSLVLNAVGVSGKTFPVGQSIYNPVLIENGSNHNWTVNVNDSVIADPPYGTSGAVLLTWNITPSVNPPITGADITFQFDRVVQTGTDFNNPVYSSPDVVQAWRREYSSYWLAAGVTAPVNTVSGNTCTAKILGLTNFSPYALSRFALPLPVKLVRFEAAKADGNKVNVNWELAACCSREAVFEVQHSRDGRNFITLRSLPGNERNRFYSVQTDGQPEYMFYRLKATDADGTVSFSQTVLLTNSKTGFSLVSVHPSPVHTNTVVCLSVPESQEAQLQITKADGRIVSQKRLYLQKGLHYETVDLSRLAAGLYHISVLTSGYPALTTAVVKQ